MSKTFATPKFGYSLHSGSHALDTLPADILSRIFTYLSSAKNFSVSCHTFSAISQDPVAVSSRLYQRYGPLLVIEFSMERHPKALTPKVLDVLLKKGALISRSHLQRFAAKPNAIKGLSAATIGALYSRGAEKFGNVDIGESDTRTVLALIETLKNPRISRFMDTKKTSEDIKKELFEFVSAFNWYPTLDDLACFNATYENSSYPDLIKLIFEHSNIANLLAHRGFFINETIDPCSFFSPTSLEEAKPLEDILRLKIIYVDKCIWLKLLKKIDPKYRHWWVYILRIILNIRWSFDPLSMVCGYIVSIDAACQELIYHHLRCISIISEAWNNHSLILDATLQFAARIPLDVDGQPTQSFIEFMKQTRPNNDKDFANWLLGRKRSGGPGIKHPFVTFMMDLDIIFSASGLINVPEFFNDAVDNGARIHGRHVELMMRKIGNTGKHCVCRFLDVVEHHSVDGYEFAVAHDNEVHNGMAVLKDVAERRRRALGDNWGEFDYGVGSVFDWCLKRWLRRKSWTIPA